MNTADLKGWGAPRNADLAAAESAYGDALRDMSRDHQLRMPTPREFAWHLPVWAVQALLQAYRSNDLANSGCPRISYDVTPQQRRELALSGLVEIKGPHLTAFGSKVRKVLLEDAR